MELSASVKCCGIRRTSARILALQAKFSDCAKVRTLKKLAFRIFVFEPLMRDPYSQ